MSFWKSHKDFQTTGPKRRIIHFQPDARTGAESLARVHGLKQSGSQKACAMPALDLGHLVGTEKKTVADQCPVLIAVFRWCTCPTHSLTIPSICAEP